MLQIAWAKKSQTPPGGVEVLAAKPKAPPAAAPAAKAPGAKAPVKVGVRSPLLDMPTPDWKQDKNGEEVRTMLLWLMDEVFSSIPLMVVPYVKQYMMRTLFGVTPEARSSNPKEARLQAFQFLGVVGKEAYARQTEVIQKLSRSVRVRGDAKSGFTVSLPVYAPNLGETYNLGARSLVRSFMSATADMSYEEQDQKMKEMHGRAPQSVLKIFGENVFYAERPLDVHFPPAEVFRDGKLVNPAVIQDAIKTAQDEAESLVTSVHLPSWFELSPEDVPKALKYLFSNVKSIRLIGSPTSARSGISTVAYDGNEKFEIDSGESALAAFKSGKQPLIEEANLYLNRIMDSRSWMIYLEFNIEPWEANYICGVADKNDYPPEPQDIAIWFTQWLDHLDSDTNVWSYRRPKSIERLNQQLIGVGVQPKQRTSPDGITIHPEYYMLGIPKELPTLHIFNENLVAHNTLPNGEFTLSAPERKNLARHESVVGEEAVALAAKEGVPLGSVEYIDWFNNKLVYTNMSGLESVLDLERCLPARAANIVTLLEAPVYGQGSSEESATALADALALIYEFAMKEGDGTFAEPHNIVAEIVERPENKEQLEDLRVLSNWGRFMQALGSPSPVASSISELFSSVERAARYATDDLKERNPWIEELNIVKFHELNPHSPVLAYRIFGELFVRAANSFTDVDLLTKNNKNLITKLQAIAVRTCILKYLDRFTEINAQDQEERKLYLNPPAYDPDFKFDEYALVQPDLTLQPHQGRLGQALTYSPLNAILGVAAGGGKTIQVLIDIAFHMHKGDVHRPLVLCPSHLVKDYVAEANYVFNGKVNVIAITNYTIKTWGEKKLLAMMAGAPPNTLVVTDYNTLKGNMVDVAYSTIEYKVSLNCELLRQVQFDGVWVDEVHYLRNVNQRSISVQRLMSEIPFKRILSGTLIVNQLDDLVNEFSLIDPTVFGARDMFLRRYAERMSGNRVEVWKPGAFDAIHRRISANAMFLTAQRKEWAAFLPPRIERYHYVPLSKEQRAVYEAILESTFDKIRLEDPELYARLTANQNGGDQENDEALASAINVYLARLDIFLGAPGSDEESKVLSESDKISPKAVETVKLMREHLAKQSEFPGKCLIFCQNHRVVDAVWDYMPKDLQAMTVKYNTSSKVKDLAEFTNNPKKMFLIGIETSLNTGTNLQFCTRLIRLQQVWTSGEMEQAESRINRPNLKGGKDTRKAVIFDMISVNRTIDVAKNARLIANMISAAKFENQGAPAYAQLDPPPLVSMSLETIKSHNDYRETLSRHHNALKTLREIQKDEYTKYRNDPRVPKEFKAVTPAGAPEGSGLLKEVPYVEGMDIYAGEDLGLTPYYDWLRDEGSESEGAVGQLIHTEWGDGEIVKEFKDSLRVKLLGSGQLVGAKKTATFIITQKVTSPTQIRNQLAKIVGMKPLDPADIAPSPVTKVIPVAPIRKGETAVTDEILNAADDDGVPQEQTFKLQMEVDPYNVWRIQAGSDVFYRITKSGNPFKVKPGQRKVRVYKTDGTWFWMDEEDESKTGSAASSKDAAVAALKYLEKSEPAAVEEEDTETDEQDQPEDVDTDEDFQGMIPPISKIKGEFYMGLGLLNGEYCLSYDGEDPETDIPQLKKAGFVLWDKYPVWSIPIKRLSQMKLIVELLPEKFTVDESYMQPLRDTLKLYSSGKNRLLHPNAAINKEFRTFIRNRPKVPTNPNEIRPYVYITATGEEANQPELYVVVDARTAAANKLNARVKVPGTKWTKSHEPWYGYITPSHSQIRELIKAIMQGGGKIENLDEIKELWVNLTPQRRKHADQK